MHGYSFNVIGMGLLPDNNVKKINLKYIRDLDKRGFFKREFNLPPSRDTIAVPNNGYVILRFRADNPGILLNLFPSTFIHSLVFYFILITLSFF